MDEQLGDSPTPWTAPGTPLPDLPEPARHRDENAGAPHADAHRPPPLTAEVALSDRARLLGLGMALAALVVALAAFAPWVRVGAVTFDGFGGHGHVMDGIVTLPVALPAVVIGLVRALGHAAVPAALVSTLLGCVIVVIAAHDLGSVENVYRVAGDYVAVTTGAGLGLTLLGGIAMAALGMVGLVVRR